MANHLTNNVEWFGLNSKRFTNAVSVQEVKVGDEIWVFDLDSYSNPPETPIKAPIVRIDPYPFIVVKIDNKEWEVYESGFGKEV